jgi:hypothetical protein
VPLCALPASTPVVTLLIVSGVPSIAVRVAGRGDGATWQLDFGGGTSQTTVDLAGGQVAGLDFGQGSSQVSLTLPRPRGTLLLKLAGGASQLLVSVPAGVPARVTAEDGASEVTLGGATYRGVAAGTVLTQPGYGTAAGRLDVDAASGVSQVTITAG